MKYFKLESNSTRSKEIGKSPQIESLFQYGEVSGVQEELRTGTIERSWQLPEPTLLNKAKPTTLLSTVPISPLLFLIFRDYFIDFLEEFKLAKFSSWPIKVHHKRAVLNEYCLFHILHPNDIEVVDYSQSEFLIGKLGDWRDPSIRRPVKVENHNNYLSLLDVLKESEKDSQIRCNKLVLDFSKTELDILRLINVPFGAGYYISEKLKNAIERKRFTGMDFIEIEEYEKRIKVM